MAPFTRHKARQLRKLESDNGSVQNGIVADRQSLEGQVLPDELFWLAAKYFLDTPRDILSLAISSRGLWNVLKIKLYGTAVHLAKSFETVEGFRQNVPLRTLLPPNDNEPSIHPSQISEDPPSPDGTGAIDEPPWTGFFNRPCMSKRSPLHSAAANGYAEMVRTLIQTAKMIWPEFLDAKDPDGETAIHIAAQNGHLDIVELLVNAECLKLSPSRCFYWAPQPLTEIMNDIVPNLMATSEGYYCLAESTPRFAVDALGLAILNRYKEIAAFLLKYSDEGLTRALRPVGISCHHFT